MTEQAVSLLEAQSKVWEYGSEERETLNKSSYAFHKSKHVLVNSRILLAKSILKLSIFLCHRLRHILEKNAGRWIHHGSTDSPVSFN